MGDAERAYMEARTLHGYESPATVDAFVAWLRDLRANDLSERGLAALGDFVHKSKITFENSFTAMVQLQFQRGLLLNALDRLAEARSTNELLLSRIDDTLGRDTEVATRAAINLAHTLRRMKKYKEELPLRERIVEASRSRNDADSPAVFMSLYDLAQNLDNLGDYQQALNLNEVVLRGYERQGVDQETLATLRWRMAYELMRLGKPKDAADMYDQVLRFASTLAPDDKFRKDAERSRRAFRIARRLGGR